jgi:tetratricopeptide (TPR) repeat protein
MYGWCGLIVILGLLPTHAPRRKPAQKRPALSMAASALDARKLFEAGLTAFENEHYPQAVDNWRQALRKDPRFTLAHLFISFVSTDPQEQKSERGRAQALAAKAAKRDRLLVKWLSGVEQEQYVPAIAAMNDLLASYPSDKHVVFLAGRWLSSQEQYEPASKLLQRATQLDPVYAAAWNQLAYCYAYTGDFSNAFAAMERYIALLPKDPNPQDSYAEILRMAGNYRDALEHYRRALQIDPTFQTSQLGIADTYSLMGEEATARAEYDKAAGKTSARSEQVNYEIQSALTYVRERKPKRSVAALDSAASQAHSAHASLLEAEAYRDMALIERDNQQSLTYLDKASAALADTSVAPGPELHQERAEVLRLRAVRLAAAGNGEAAKQALKELDALQQATHGTALSHTYAGAMGSVLVVNQRYAEAVPYLEEDTRNPLSMRDLIVAYTKVGTTDRAHVLEMKLAAFNQPTVEQALVVPELRTKLAATKEKRSWLRKLMAGDQ